MFWNILEWTLWGLAALMSTICLLIPHRDGGVRSMFRTQGFVLALGLAATAYFPFSKFHLLWIAPFAFLSAFPIQMLMLRFRFARLMRQSALPNPGVLALLDERMLVYMQRNEGKVQAELRGYLASHPGETLSHEILHTAICNCTLQDFIDDTLAQKEERERIDADAEHLSARMAFFWHQVNHPDDTAGRASILEEMTCHCHTREDTEEAIARMSYMTVFKDDLLRAFREYEQEHPGDILTDAAMYEIIESRRLHRKIDEHNTIVDYRQKNPKKVKKALAHYLKEHPGETATDGVIHQVIFECKAQDARDTLYAIEDEIEAKLKKLRDKNTNG